MHYSVLFLCGAFDFSQVLTAKKMIASLFPSLTVQTQPSAVLLVSHARLYHTHYGDFATAARFVLTEGRASHIHTAVLQ